MTCKREQNFAWLQHCGQKEIDYNRIFCYTVLLYHCTFIEFRIKMLAETQGNKVNSHVQMLIFLLIICKMYCKIWNPKKDHLFFFFFLNIKDRILRKKNNGKMFESKQFGFQSKIYCLSIFHWKAELFKETQTFSFGFVCLFLYWKDNGTSATLWTIQISS